MADIVGCEHLFSCDEIESAEALGLDFWGYYETENSYWGIYLYAVK